tara:strand:+ start:664 stop:1089 length:426 start_codon:yes stop_codon:yes gene_type:complete
MNKDAPEERLLELGRATAFSPLMNPEYKPKWVCSECGSSEVQTMDDAWFDPNNDYCFIGAVECGGNMDWCNDCENETTLDEAEPPDDPWGNAYGSPMYWIPPEGDEYWDERDVYASKGMTWDWMNENSYWTHRLGETNDSM